MPVVMVSKAGWDVGGSFPCGHGSPVQKSDLNVNKCRLPRGPQARVVRRVGSGGQAIGSVGPPLFGCTMQWHPVAALPCRVHTGRTP